MGIRTQTVMNFPQSALYLKKCMVYKSLSKFAKKKNICESDVYSFYM